MLRHKFSHRGTLCAQTTDMAADDQAVAEDDLVVGIILLVDGKVLLKG